MPGTRVVKLFTLAMVKPYTPSPYFKIGEEAMNAIGIQSILPKHVALK